MLTRNLLLALAGTILAIPSLAGRVSAADREADEIKKEVLKAVDRLIDRKLQDFRRELLDDIRGMLEKGGKPEQRRIEAGRDDPRPQEKVQVEPRAGHRVVILGKPGKEEKQGERKMVKVIRGSGEMHPEAEVEVEVRPVRKHGRSGSFAVQSGDGRTLRLDLDDDGAEGKARIVIVTDGETIDKEIPIRGLPRMLRALKDKLPEGVDIGKMLERFMSGGEGGIDQFLEGFEGMGKLPRMKHAEGFRVEGAPKALEFEEGMREWFGSGAQRRSDREQRGPKRETRPERPAAEAWEKLRAEKEALEEELSELKSMLRKLIEKKKERR